MHKGQSDHMVQTRQQEEENGKKQTTSPHCETFVRPRNKKNNKLKSHNRPASELETETRAKIGKVWYVKVHVNISGLL